MLINIKLLLNNCNGISHIIIPNFMILTQPLHISWMNNLQVICVLFKIYIMTVKSWWMNTTCEILIEIFSKITTILCQKKKKKKVKSDKHSETNS